VGRRYATHLGRRLTTVKPSENVSRRIRPAESPADGSLQEIIFATVDFRVAAIFLFNPEKIRQMILCG
jgi:hypothetical protein